MKEKKIFALGFFDGVHLGHQALLTACRALAIEYGCKAGAVTFSQHPDALVLGSTPKLINTINDRKQLLSDMGAETIITLPFDKALMVMPWQRFISLLRNEYGAVGFVCGADFRFGHKGSGDAEKLAAFCREKSLACAVVADQTVDGVRVSSTHIRSLLEQGDMEAADRFLGHAHVLSGEVVSGRRLGRTIGVPTANIRIPEEVVVPKLGVYACIAEVGGESYVAVTNVGSRPTVEGHEVRAESWLLSFDGDLYGETIKLHFYKYLRPEEKFASLEELRQQIQKDAGQAYKIFEKV